MNLAHAGVPADHEPATPHASAQPQGASRSRSRLSIPWGFPHRFPQRLRHRGPRHPQEVQRGPFTACQVSWELVINLLCQLWCADTGWALRRQGDLVHAT